LTVSLIGAVALRLSVFSPDAICGITPIELMLEINEFDQSGHPTPELRTRRRPGLRWLYQRFAGAGRRGRRIANLLRQAPLLTPIDTPLTICRIQ